MATLLEILSDPSANWMRSQPASDKAIRALIAKCDFPLPEEFLSFLRYSNGGEGPLCIEPWWFRIDPAEQVIENNNGYSVEESVPGHFMIGSSGGGEMFVIRKQDGSPCPVYMVPFIPMRESERLLVARDFEAFAMAFGRERL